MLPRGESEIMQCVGAADGVVSPIKDTYEGKSEEGMGCHSSIQGCLLYLSLNLHLNKVVPRHSHNYCLGGTTLSLICHCPFTEARLVYSKKFTGVLVLPSNLFPKDVVRKVVAIFVSEVRTTASFFLILSVG